MTDESEIIKTILLESVVWVGLDTGEAIGLAVVDVQSNGPEWVIQTAKAPINPRAKYVEAYAIIYMDRVLAIKSGEWLLSHQPSGIDDFRIWISKEKIQL